MTRNKAYLAEYHDFNGGPVTFRGSKGYITGKGKIKTGKLDFEDVCFVKELQVLFTDSECLVLSPEFKLPDANQVLLRIPRQNNMYSFNLENLVPSGGLARLIAKSTIDESNKWHRRLGHVNFKNLNKLVKGNLVRGLPLNIFQNDHTCVACQKGKQHKASCKAKSVSSISQPLQLLYMDLFGPTSPPPFVNPDDEEELHPNWSYLPLNQKVKETNLTNINKSESKRDIFNCPNTYELKLPYRRRNVEKRQEKDKVQLQKFWKMFKQLHFNISLADALILMPKYTKMLKDLCANKEKLEELANTPLSENCSAVILKKLPEKLGDSCRFTIPCDFSKLKCQGLADLGASINLMPLSVFHRLGFTNLESTQMTLELANRQLCRPDGICKDVLVPVGKFTYPADFVVVDYVPDEQIPLILGRPFLRTARALIDVYDEKLILRDGNESLTLNMQSEKSKLNGIQKVESINMIDIFNVPNYIGFKDLFAQMYSGSPTIQSDDSFPSSSPMKTSDSTFEKFTDEFTLPNSLLPGDDVSILKKDFQEDTFQTISNPLLEFDDSFKSSNMNPLFEENDKDIEIKSSSSFTLTSSEESEFEAYLERDSIPPGIDLTRPPTFEVSSSNPTSPTLTGEKDHSKKMSMFFSLIRFVWRMMYRVLIRRKILYLLATYLHKKPKPPQEVQKVKMKDNKVSSEIPINVIAMPIRITFDNPIDFNDHFSKPKDLKKDLTISFDSTTTSILPHPLLDSDSPFTAELSASVILNSLGNEDKVFKPGILVYHAIHDKNLVTLEEKLKENISSGTLLVFKEPSFLLPPPEPPDECLKNVVLNFYQNQKTFPLHIADGNTFAFVIWTFLPHFTYSKDSPLIFSSKSENFVFDPGIESSLRLGFSQLFL
ncbi:reverse transcriptase domain-containing protein [Tanacetum coccineum]